MKYILALDPGGHTGWALAQYDDDIPMTFIDGGQIADGVDGFVEWWYESKTFTFLYGRGLDIQFVSESFVQDGRTKFPDLTPVRIEGALTALAGKGRVIYQRNVFKSYVGDSALREHGFWIPGQRHQMDARLHALAWAKTNHLPTTKAYWPEHES